MVSGVARAQVAIVTRFVIFFTRSQRTQADRCEQPLAHRFDDRLPARTVKHRVFQRDGKNLVRATGRVIALLAVYDVEEITTRLVPEAAVEGIACAFRM